MTVGKIRGDADNARVQIASLVLWTLIRGNVDKRRRIDINVVVSTAW